MPNIYVMKKRFLLVLAFLFIIFDVFCAEPKAKEIIAEAQKKETADDSLDFIKDQIAKITVPAEKRAVYIFMASLQEQMNLFDEAKVTYATAAGISAASIEGLPKKTNEQLVLDGVRCALSSGDFVTADNYLNSAVRNSKSETVQAYIKLYTQWSALCKAETQADINEPIEILKVYSKVDSMNCVKPAVLLTLWYLTGEDNYSKEISASYSKSIEAAIVKGEAQLLPTPFWFFVPKIGEAEQSIESMQTPSVASELEKSSKGAESSLGKSGGGSDVVKLQLGLFRTENNAKYLVNELKDKGFDCYITTETRSSGTTYYIVLINENKERSIADKLRSSGYECYIVE